MSIDVVGPPISYPRVTVNHTATCSFEGVEPPATFAVTDLLYFGYPNLHPNSSVNVGKAAVDLLKYLHDNSSAHDEYFGECTIDLLGAAAYRINEQIDLISAFNPSFTDYCDASLEDMPPATALTAAVRTAIQEDFQYNLRQLPDLLYPCSQRIFERIPVWTMMWDIFTAMSAFLGPLFTIIILILRGMERRESDTRAYSQTTSEMRLEPFDSSPMTGESEPETPRNRAEDTQSLVSQLKSP
ncbi:hypothetical protein DL93DRAFT_2087785 [Clavulina sp. PMI_390]|nr:hypothetical protein DL93DRAFT_2087785 [Clavulina sp. PMI_390]